MCSVQCAVCSVQIGRLTGSERNLVALCAFSQVIQVIGERVGRRVRGRATHGAPQVSSFAFDSSQKFQALVSILARYFQLPIILLVFGLILSSNFGFYSWVRERVTHGAGKVSRFNS